MSRLVLAYITILMVGMFASAQPVAYRKLQLNSDPDCLDLFNSGKTRSATECAVSCGRQERCLMFKRRDLRCAFYGVSTGGAMAPTEGLDGGAFYGQVPSTEGALYFPMDVITHGVLLGALPGRALDGAQIESCNRGRCLHLEGQTQAIDFGYQGKRCLANLSLCAQGLSFFLWLRLLHLTSPIGFVLDSGGTSPTSQGVSIFYQSGSLVNAFKRRNTAWRTEAKEIDLDIWYHVAITWSDADGARMYIDGCLREHSFTEIPMEFTDAETPFYIGKSNSEVRDEHQELAMDDMYIFEEFKDAKFVKEFYIQY